MRLRLAKTKWCLLTANVTRILILANCMFVSPHITAQILSGRITDNDTHEQLAYASVGVKNKKGGGITSRDGAFSIDLSTLTTADSILFSHIGYETVAYAVGSIDVSKLLEVKLKRQAKELEEFVVKAKVEILTIGNTKSSGRFTGWGDYSNSRGRARGLQVEPKAFPLKLTGFVCRVRYNTFDSVKIRINLFKKGEGPNFEQLLQHNIYYTIPKNAKWINVDLTPYSIVIKDTVILAIEWIDSWSDGKNTAGQNELFTISLGKQKGYCYERNTPNEIPVFRPCDEVPAMYLKGFRAGKK